MKKIFFSFSYLLLISCGIKTYVLDNGYTKVPISPRDFIDENFLNNHLKVMIDTSLIYEQFNENRNILSRLDSNFESNFYSVLKFYDNGCFNKFYLDRDNQLLNINSFNPSYSGYRGFYSKINNEIRFEIFVPVTELRKTGKLSGFFNIQGDTIYMKTDKYKEVEVFIKRKMPKEYLNFKADW